MPVTGTVGENDTTFEVCITLSSGTASLAVEFVAFLTTIAGSGTPPLIMNADNIYIGHDYYTDETVLLKCVHVIRGPSFSTNFTKTGLEIVLDNCFVFPVFSN